MDSPGKPKFLDQKAQLIRLFHSAYGDDPWLGVSIKDTLDSITAEVAVSHPIEQCNSIWQIVRHMVEWQKTIIRRMNGETVPSPEHNYIFAVQKASPPAWKQLLNEMDEVRQQLLEAIRKFDFAKLNSPEPYGTVTFFELLYGLLQHDSYHLGQIVLLAKASGEAS